MSNKTDYLVQCARNEHERLLRLCEPIHQEYADRHSLTYIPSYGPVAPSKWWGGWDSIILTLDLMKKDARWVFAIDSDTLIVGDNDPRDVMGNYLIGMTVHPNPTHYNTGVIFVKSHERIISFYEKILTQAPGEYPWFEQTCINNSINELQEDNLVKVLPVEWNSTVVLSHPEDCVIRAWHAFGGFGGVQSRLDAMREEIKNRGL